MEIWFTSDIHFGHSNIIKHANRPFADVEEMDEGLVREWNARIGKEDTVYFLGDFSFHKEPKTRDIFFNLNGRNKHLVRGNHDGKAVTGLPWTTQSDLTTLKFGGNRFELCHYPLEVWNAAHHGAFHLHGHSHGTLERSLPRRMDVGVDLHPTWAPFHWSEVVEKLSQEDYAPADHHGPRTH